MPKISRKQQIEDERKILAELQKNSNENIDKIAKHCGLSKQKVSRTIKQLEKNHFIWGYTAIVDEEKKDVLHFIMLIKKTVKQLDKKIKDRIDSIKIEDFTSTLGITIESSCLVHGTYDWVISFTAPDIIIAKKFCDSFYLGFPEIIEHIDLLQTLVFVRKHHIFNPDRKKLSDFL
jgi:DNA-binding Lrp family transcriptional regulator